MTLVSDWEKILGEKIIHAPECPHDAAADVDETADCECYVTELWDALHASSDREVEWLLGEARANIAELVDDLKGFYIPEKGWPPHIDKAAEVIAEIDDMLAPAEGTTHQGHPMYQAWLSYRDFERILLALGASGSDVKRLWPNDLSGGSAMNVDILKRMRDALETAAGQYGPVTDAERNEWLGLVQEHDAHRWAVVAEPLEAPVEDDPHGAVD